MAVNEDSVDLGNVTAVKLLRLRGHLTELRGEALPSGRNQLVTLPLFDKTIAPGQDLAVPPVRLDTAGQAIHDVRLHVTGEWVDWDGAPLVGQHRVMVHPDTARAIRTWLWQLAGYLTADSRAAVGWPGDLAALAHELDQQIRAWENPPSAGASRL